MTGTENGSDVVLDGNAAAGLLQEIFVSDITSAESNARHAAPSRPLARCVSMRSKWEQF